MVHPGSAEPFSGGREDAPSPPRTRGPWLAVQINGEAKPWAVIGQCSIGDQIVAAHCTEADAKLLALAPELLEALEDAANWVSAFISDYDYGHAAAEETQKRIRGLISSAKQTA